ncbi:MAG: tetrahydromethanopterin S-methyltransferase subunit G [Candidatus Methanogasteraceae archaeon]|nr:MAG: tetrahydromethanopterin S-methyltransferase subunit G [ANME-2 cluster archaeon]
MDYEKMMKRLDRAEENIEFAGAEIIQSRGTMIGRGIGITLGAVAALIMVSLLGW